MTKTVWGYILLTLFGLCVFGSFVEWDEDSPSGLVGGTIMFGVPGLLLTKAGKDNEAKVKRFTNAYLQLAGNGTPNVNELARSSQLTADEVLVTKALAEKRGLLPYGSELSLKS